MTTDEATPLPEVRVLPHDLLRVLEGRTLRVGEPGAECLLRLFTAEEFLVAQHAAVDRTGANQGNKIGLDRAIELTAPLHRPGPSRR